MTRASSDRSLPVIDAGEVSNHFLATPSTVAVAFLKRNDYLP